MTNIDIIAEALETSADPHGLIVIEAVGTELPRYVLIDVDVPEEGARVGLYEGDDDRPLVLVHDLDEAQAIGAAHLLTSAYVMTREG